MPASKKYGLGVVGSILCLVALGVWVTGCPGSPGTGTTGGKSGVTVVFSSNQNSLMSALIDSIGSSQGAVVSIYDIYSLTVTVNEVTLIPDDSESADTSQGENDTTDSQNQNGDKESSDSGGVVVFQGAQDVNLVDMTLSGLSQLLSTDNVPPGKYEGITINISNPRLVLKADLNTVITDVQLTANGRLFIKQDFELPAVQHSLIVLDFGGIHLVHTGQGKYVLTPQLRATITVQNAAVTLQGTIVSVDTSNHSMVIDNNGQNVTVFYDPTKIFLSTDTTTPTGTEADLTVGASVTVDGFMEANGTVTATEVHLQ